MKISSYIFAIEGLSPFKGKVYITHSDGPAMFLGRIQLSPIDGDIIYTDADFRPLSHLLKFTDLPKPNAEHGTTHMIGFMSKLATSFIGHAGEAVLSALEIKDLNSVLSGLDVYSVHPLTAYVAYHSEYKRKEQQMNPNENKKIGHITSYVFLVFRLVPFECEIYTIYDGTGNGESLGILKQSPFHYGDLLFFDADKVPLFSFTPKADLPTKFHDHGTTHVITFMKDVATKLIKFVQRQDHISARKVKNVPELVEGCHVYTAHPLTAYITYHKPEKKKVSTLDVDKIAKNIAQSIVAVENDQSCALFVKDPINGNEYTLNITGFDNDGRLLANVVKIMKGE